MFAFKEPRSDGESNAKIASIIEYGKQGQPPNPFLKSAKPQFQTGTSRFTSPFILPVNNGGKLWTAKEVQK